MNTIFQASAAFPVEKVADFAAFLGYQATVTQNVLDEQGNVTSFNSVVNTQSANDFIAEKFKDYCTSFAAGYELQQINVQAEAARVAAIQQANDAISAAITVTVQ